MNSLTCVVSTRTKGILLVCILLLMSMMVMPSPANALDPLFLNAGKWTKDITFSPDGQKLAIADNKVIKVFDADSGTLLNTLEGHTKTVSAVSFSPDGTRLASSSWDKSVLVWDLSTDTIETRLVGHTGAVESVLCLPDGKRIISCGADKTLRVWSLATGKTLLTLKGHNGTVLNMAISPDGKLVASGGGYVGGTAVHDFSVRIWDLASGKQLATYKGHKGEVLRLKFSTDGKQLATGGAEGTILLWNLGKNKLSRMLTGYSDQKPFKSVNGLAYLPNDKYLVSVGGNRFPTPLHFWNIATGKYGVIKQINEFKKATGAFTGMAISPDGKKLAILVGLTDFLIVPIDNSDISGED